MNADRLPIVAADGAQAVGQFAQAVGGVAEDPLVEHAGDVQHGRALVIDGVDGGLPGLHHLLHARDRGADRLARIAAQGRQFAHGALVGELGGHAAGLGHLIGEPVFDLDEFGFAQSCTRAGLNIWSMSV